MNERTFNQIDKQQSSAYMNGSGDAPTVLIKRSSGNITVGRLDMGTKEVHFSEHGQEWIKPVGIESLTDARQEQLAEELAGRALRGTVELEPDNASPSLVEFDESGLIKVPDWMQHEHDAGSEIEPAAARESEPVIDPLDALDEDVRIEVGLYRRAVQDKRQSERDKNFAQAAEDKRAIYRVQQSLSLAAKEFLGIQ